MITIKQVLFFTALEYPFLEIHYICYCDIAYAIVIFHFIRFGIPIKYKLKLVDVPFKANITTLME